MASQLASLLELPGITINNMTIHALALGAMEDERVYAVKISLKSGLEDGLRRNYMWEPIPMDDDIAENSVQGLNPIKIDGERVGNVSVWISPRMNDEEAHLLARRELWSLLATVGLWTLTFALIFWQWGDARRLKRKLGALFSSELPGEDGPSNQVKPALAPENSALEKPDMDKVVNAAAGRRFQRHNPDSWLVTAVMFRQTFARGPALIGRLYASGENAGLCHLGRMLEQAAPCIGANRLAQAARNMQRALNDPDCQIRATEVEECAAALDEVLNALCGNGRWHGRAYS